MTDGQYSDATAGFNEAAANGRGNLGVGEQVRLGALGASMRPRRMAAEIGRPPPPGRQVQRRFNEAAANGRGNREAAGIELVANGALQ